SESTSSNPLVLHGCHFGQTVFALCNYPALLTGNTLRLEELQDSPIEDYPADIQREHRVFMELVESYQGLANQTRRIHAHYECIYLPSTTEI
ncbi:uncharacterized protein HD556DRAFT_1223940, partial [Suillus plorans]